MSLTKKVLAAIAALGVASSVSPKADAALLTGDLNPNPSTAAVTFAAPSGVSFTGGDGIGEGKYAPTSASQIFIYDGTTTTPEATINTPFSNISGLAYRGRDGSGDPLVTLSAGTSLYEGTLSGGSFNIDSVIGLTGITSDTTDVTFGLDNHYIATQSDGVRRVESDGSTTLTFNASGVESYDILDVIAGTYINPAEQIDGENFTNIDNNGIAIGSGTFVNLNNATTIEGIAYFDSDNNPLNGVDGGLAVIQGPGIQIHTAPTYASNITDPVPEPATLALLAAGSATLLSGRRKEQKYQSTE